MRLSLQLPTTGSENGLDLHVAPPRRKWKLAVRKSLNYELSVRTRDMLIVFVVFSTLIGGRWDLRYFGG